MKYTLALLLVAVVSAEAKAQAPDETKRSPRGLAAATGCLTAGDQPGTFFLRNARVESGAGESKSGAGPRESEGAAPPQGAAPQQKPAVTLRLAGLTARPTLEEHVGRIVTVSGTLVAEDRTVTPGIILPDGAGGQAGRKPQVEGKSGPRIFTVQSVTRVGQECK
jgi:hypothetical protein